MWIKPKGVQIMAKRKPKSDYKTLFENKFNEVQRVLGNLTKGGYSIDVEYYQNILSTFGMDAHQGFNTLNQLSKRETIMQNMYKIDVETGERVSMVGEIWDRLMAVPKSYEYTNPLEYAIDAPQYAKIAIANFKMELQTYSALIANKSSADGLSNVETWFNNLLSTYGEQAVGKMLMDASEHGIQLSFEVMYDSTSATNFINEMMNFLDEQGYSQNDLDVLKAIQEEMTDGERLAEDEDGNPII